MHWVDRGAEPSGLEAVRLQYTQEWIERNRGRRPTPRWQQFHSDLCRAFSGLCGYCEEIDKGEIDHFKPTSKFPALVYEWSNWIFSCHTCNQKKSNKWPAGGYVDPCAASESERPENFFDFNTLSKKLIPNPNTSPENQAKADGMIKDLGLNDPHHIKARAEKLYHIEHHLARLTEDSDEETEFLATITDRSFPLSSIARKLLEERDFAIAD